MTNQPPGHAAAFKALSNENRLKVFDLIRLGRRAGASCGNENRPADIPPSAVCVCEILEKLDITAPTLSHHLKELRTAGLVDVFHRGQWSYYTARNAALEELAAYLTAPARRKQRTPAAPARRASATKRRTSK